MKSYKKEYLERHHKIKTVKYNYDKPLNIFRYIKYLRKQYDKLMKYCLEKNLFREEIRNKKKHPRVVQFEKVVEDLLNIQADIRYFEDDQLDLFEKTLREIKLRLEVYQRMRYYCSNIV